MARLSGVPNELILEITDHVSPSDMDAFCMISKHIRAVAQPLLKQHMHLKGRYTNWRNKSEPGLKFSGHLATLLKAILDNPRAALYVTSLHINGYKERRAIFKAKPDMLSSFNKCVQACAVIPDDQKGFWIEQLKAGNEDPVIGLLLLQLPNLTRLRLAADFWDVNLTPYMAKRIGFSEPSVALTHLRTVELKEVAEFPADNTDLFKCFSLLPSLERLSVADTPLAHEYLEPELQAMVRTRKSPIRHLYFKNVHLCHTLLLDILAASDCLETFAYYGSDESPEADPEAKQFQDALLANAKETLEHLTLHLDNEFPLTSLRGFKVLETVDLSAELLRYLDLAELLPRSIKTLTLRDTRFDTLQFESFLFTNHFLGPMPTVAFEKVPNLKRINYEFTETFMHTKELSAGYFYREVYERASRYGIRLVVSWPPEEFRIESAEDEIARASMRKNLLRAQLDAQTWYLDPEHGNRTSGGVNTVSH